MTKQPKALSIFFLTEMWERYGFYVIQTLLILYLINVFQTTDKFAYGTLGSITALAYGNSIVGGYIADRLIGHRYAVLSGSVMLSLGYVLVMMAPNLSLTFFAFATVTMGTGLLKPNISSMLGALYKKNDARRHGGFTLFYVGINSGIILGETVAGYIQRYLGWHSVFFSAGFVLIIAFCIFYWGTRKFDIMDIYPLRKTWSSWAKSVLISLLALALSFAVLSYQSLADYFFIVVAAASVLIVIYHSFRERGVARYKLFAYLIMVGISTFYWAIYFQMFFSMTLFVDRVVDRSFFGMEMVPAVFPSIEAFSVIILGLILGWFWTWLKRKSERLSPSTPMKFALALLMHAIAFGILFVASLVLEKNGMVAPGWLIAVYIIIAVGELLLSPIGLAMVTELVPMKLVGMMMGIFFISLGLGGKLAGVFADISAIPKGVTSVSVIEGVYHHAFLDYFLICLVATMISLALVPVMKRLIHSTPAKPA